MIMPFRPRLAFRLLLIAALLPAAPCLAGAATLTGTVDHDFLSTHETVDYVLSLAGGSEGREPPDVSALARDFDIVGRNRRSRSEVVDGKPVEVEDWVITLAPKRPGVFTIPGLSVDGLSSAPVKLQVVPGLPADETDDRSMFVRVDAGDVAPFAQGLVPVVVRIYDGVGLRKGAMGQLTADGAVLTPQGSQRVYFKTGSKRRYGVIEQSFLMQPQKSGRIIIDPVTVEASIPGKPTPADAGVASFLGRPPFPAEPLEQVQLKSRPVAIDVKPRPEAAEGWFLPARGVTLTQDWSASPQKAKVGVALTRTLRLRARGAGPNQLPALPVTEVEGLRQYEDASRSERVGIDGEAGAELVKTISVVPTRPGRITLPAITVAWWNIDAARQEQVTLPAVTLDVAGDGSVAAPTAPAPVVAAPGSPPPEALPPPRRLDLAMLAQVVWDYAWLAVAGLAALVIARWLRARRWRRPAASAPPGLAGSRAASGRGAAFADAAAAEQALRRACAAGDARGAHAALLAWFRLSGAGPDTPARTPQMAVALGELRLALYGGQPVAWRGKDLLRAFEREKRIRRRAVRSARRSRLAPLYPVR